MVKFADYQLGQLRKIAFQYNEQLRIKDVSKISKNDLVKALEERLELSADGRKIRIKQMDLDNPEFAELKSAVVKEVLKERPKDIIFYKDGTIEEGAIEPLSEKVFNRGFKNIVYEKDGELINFSVILFEKETKGWVETNREYMLPTLPLLLDKINGAGGVIIENTGVEDGFALYEGKLKPSVVNSGYWVRVILDAFARTIKDNKLPSIYFKFINIETKLETIKTLITAEEGWKEITMTATKPAVQGDEEKMRQALKKPPTKKQVKALEEAEAKKPEKIQGTKVLLASQKAEMEKAIVLPSEDIVTAPVRDMDLVLESKLLPVFNPPTTLEKLAQRAITTKSIERYLGRKLNTYVFKRGKIEILGDNIPWNSGVNDKQRWRLGKSWAKNYAIGETGREDRSNISGSQRKSGLDTENFNLLVKRSTLLGEDIKQILKKQGSSEITFFNKNKENLDEKVLAHPVIDSELWVNMKEYLLRKREPTKGDIEYVDVMGLVVGSQMLVAGFSEYIYGADGERDFTNPVFKVWLELLALEKKEEFQTFTTDANDWFVLYNDTKKVFLQAIMRIVSGLDPKNEISFIDDGEKYQERELPTEEERSWTLDYSRISTFRPKNYLKKISFYSNWGGANGKYEEQKKRGQRNQLLDREQILFDFYEITKKMATVLKDEYKRVKRQRLNPADKEALKAKEKEDKRLKEEEQKKQDALKAEKARKLDVETTIGLLGYDLEEAQREQRSKSVKLGSDEYFALGEKIKEIQAKITALQKGEKAPAPAPAEVVMIKKKPPKAKVDEGSARPVSKEKEKYASAYAEAIGDIEFIMEEATNAKDKTEAQDIKTRLDEIWRNNWYKDEEDRLIASLKKAVEEARTLGVDVSQRL